MKLRNKKTGQTGYYLHTHRDHKNGRVKVAVLEDGKPFSEFKPYEPVYDYDSLAELNEEWEDYKEPKEIWTITTFGEVQSGNPEEDIIPVDPRLIDKLKEIGNCFESLEEAEKAVEKLKAWKRLKDKGFRFTGWDRHPDYPGDYRITASDEWTCDDKDLDLLFGGEND